MTIIQSNHAGLGGAGAPGGALASFYSHTIDQSLRFNDGDDPYLTFTPSSATNQKTWTYSLWVKRTTFAARQCLLAAGTGGGLVMEFRFGLSDELEYLDSSSTYLFITTQKFRDPAAWYHLVLRVDTTQSSANDRTRLYVNGEQVTSFSTDNRSNHTLNEDLAVNTNTVHYISRWVTGGENHDGYFAEINFLDGVSVDCNSFGEFKDGVWIPKQYSGSYGTNGWHLDFADSSDIGNNANTTDGTNDWTPNNLAASDIVPDTPTNNFATMNPIYHSSSQATLSEGNLKVDGAGFVNAADGYGAVSTFTIPKDKKIYIEVECTDGVGSNWFAGFASQSGLESGPSSTSVGGANAITVYNRSVYINGSETDYGSSAGLGGLGVANLAAGDILGCAIDGATGKVWFSRNGTYFKSPSTNNSGTTGDPAGGNHEIGTITNGTTEDVFFVIGSNTSVSSIFVNFGQDSVNVASANADGEGIGTFEYAPPTDYLALCASNLSDPTIGPGQSTQADDHFDIILWTGNGASSHGITQTDFLSPDLVWLKRRNGTAAHFLYDTIRGATKGIHSNLTDPETTYSDGLLSFDSNGFTVGDRGNHNDSSDTFVAWCWKAGGSASSNSDGSITSSVSANTTAGFSIVSFTTDGVTSGTVGHGLGVQPQLIIGKTRNHDVGWYIQSPLLDADLTLAFDTAAPYNPGYNHWNDTHPTSSVFSVGGYMADHADLNNPSTKIVYCFANVEGFSKVGLYEGNSSADGTYVHLNFRPKYVMLKKIDSTPYGWNIHDTVRDTLNPDETSLWADTNNAENGIGLASDWRVDLLSNGFKLTENTNYINQSGKTVIYLAFAETPFKFANAR